MAAGSRRCDSAAQAAALGEQVKRLNARGSGLEAELCAANPYGLMLSRDEISGWFETLTRAGKEGDREFFLEAWSGDGEHSYDRIGRGCLYIPHVCLSLFGTIQPGKLDSLIHSAGQDGKGADGLLQRFQILLYPDRRGPRSYVDEPADKDAQIAYNAVYKKLANDEWKSICTFQAGIPIAGPDESSFHYFHFDDEAFVCGQHFRSAAPHRDRARGCHLHRGSNRLP